MPICLQGYLFEGPFADTSMLENRSGVFVIFDNRDGQLFYIDCGESARVRTRVQKHDRSWMLGIFAQWTSFVCCLLYSEARKN
jgi:hypothetical protein